MYGKLLRRPRRAGDAPARAGILLALATLTWPAGVLRAQQDAPPAPPVMHFCWTNCFTLQLTQGHYTRVDGTEESWSIERFTPQSVILHRHDAPAAWNGFSADVIYAGQVSDSQLINVTVGGNPVKDIHAAWGVALESLPASNAERDQRLSVPIPTEPAVDILARTSEAPPPLPDEAQPPCPVDGYLWTPGYWGWSGTGYFWMPGAWVQPPRVGVLWTPGYWGFVGTVYVLHRGYWGPHVGYYGGINYGFGYGGVGFTGGRWLGDVFAYNSSVSNVRVSEMRNTYRQTAVASRVANRVSYNGGPGGISAVPTAEERAAEAEARIPRTTPQRASPPQLAMPGPAVFLAPQVVPRVASSHRTTAPTAGGSHPPAPASLSTTPPQRPAPVPQLAAVQPAAPKPPASTATTPQHPKH